jgi:hypothetical protein
MDTLVQMDTHKGEMDMLTIPIEYQKLSQNKAAKLVGIPRTTFKRKYWDNGELSIQKDREGNDYVPFDELYRVFGEELLQAIHQETGGQQNDDRGHDQNGQIGTNGHDHMDRLVQMDTPKVSVDIPILLENERLKAEKEGMQNLVQELRDQLERERNRLSDTERQVRQLDTQYRALLEDKRHNEDQGKRLNELQAQQETLTKELTEAKQQKPWFKKWFRG